MRLTSVTNVLPVIKTPGVSGERPAPLNNWNFVAKGRKTPTEKPGPLEWGFGVGLLTLHSKNSVLWKPINHESNYLGSSTMTCQTPEDDYIRWDVGSMASIGHSYT